MPANIVFPPTSAPGLRLQESGGRLINSFAEKAATGAPSTIIHRRSAGLERLAVTEHVHTRGFLDIGSEAFWILNDRLVKVDATFTVSDIGALAGTQSVTTAKNNKVAPGIPDFVAVTENGAFTLTTTGPPTPFGGLSGSPTSVCDFDGFFVWSFGDGTIVASNLNSTTVNPASFATEHGLFVRRVVRYAGRLYAFGDKWTGVYKDTGTVPFPFTREVTIPRGIVGTHAISGWEAGWANVLIWVGDDFIVYKLDGYTPTPVSTDDVSRAVQQAVIGGDSNNIVSFVYMFGKSAFWVMSCPGRWTWEYNTTTGEWNERESYNKLNWKGMHSLRMFNRWLIGDQYTGELYQTSATYFREGVEPLIWQVESGVLVGFPRGIVIPRASFHITTGVGTYATVASPKIEISWSLDGGYSYGDPVIRRLGMAGETHSHPYVLTCGLSRGQGVRFRLKVADAVHVGLSGGVVESEQRGFSG